MSRNIPGVNNKNQGDIENGLSSTDNITSTVTDTPVTDKKDDSTSKSPDSILNNKETPRSVNSVDNGGDVDDRGEVDESLLPKNNLKDPLKINADVGLELQAEAEAKAQAQAHAQAEAEAEANANGYGDAETTKSLISGLDNISVLSDNYINLSSSDLLEKIEKRKKIINKYVLNNISDKYLIKIKKNIKDIISKTDLFCENYKKLKVEVENKNNIRSLYDFYKCLAIITEKYIDEKTFLYIEKGKLKECNKKLENTLDDIKKIMNEFNNNNDRQLEELRNSDLRMVIKHEKEFNDHLNKKLSFLNERLDLLQMKYNEYKKWYDRTNIFIIIISTVLSVFESFRLEVEDLIPPNSHGLELFFNMLPIGISSVITCSAAIIKFRKYQEKMENMQFTREKVITSISRIENIKESLWFNDDNDFDNIKKNYLSEVFTAFNESTSELQRHLKYDDPHKFVKNLNEKNKENYKNKNIYI